MPKLDNSFGDEWEFDGNGHWHECVRDNCTVKSDEGSHADDNNDHKCDDCTYVMSDCKSNAVPIVKKDATCTEDGNIEHWTCSGCKKNFSDEECTTIISGSVTISALGHNMVLDTTKGVNGYTWADDYSSCTAHGKCDRTGCTYTEDADATITPNKIEDATCTLPERSDIDYSFSFSWAKGGRLDLVQTNPALGHDFDTENWSIDDANGHYHACKRENCSEKDSLTPHTFENGICDTCDVHNTFGTEGLTYTYNSISETYSVLAYNGEELDVVIPYFYNDGTNSEHKVTEIGNGAFASGIYKEKQYANNNNITSVVIPDSINKICIASFAFCKEITTVVIPNSVTILEDGVFCYCEKLENITISNNLKRASANIFHNTAWFRNQTDELVYIGNYLYRLSGQKSSVSELVIKEGTIGIFAYAAYTSDGFTSVIIPNTVEWIDTYAFYNTHITEITIPASVKNIYQRAFGECRSLKSIHISATVEFVDDYAFTWGKGLTEITIESGNTKFGEGVFNNCGDLNNSEALVVTLPSDMQSISKSMFSNSGIKSIEIPSSVTKIEKNAFYQCRGLKEFTIQGSVSYIGEGVFNYCNNLETITISSNVETICNNAFGECEKLKTVTFQCTLDSLRTKANDLNNDHWFENTSKELVIYYNGGSFKPYHSAVEASCTETGNVEYWVEILTNETYKNKSYGTKITDVVVPVTEHTFGEWTDEVPATCTSTGTKGHKDCLVCGKHFDIDGGEIENLTISIDSTAHNYGEWSSNNDGTHSRTCSYNSEHIETVNCSGGSATCTEKAICSVCSQPYGDLAAHTFDQEKAEDKYLASAATCIAKARYYYSCTCGEKGTTTYEYGEMDIHFLDNDVVCTVCDNVIEDPKGITYHYYSMVLMPILLK